MGARRPERGARDVDNGDGEHDEGHYLDRGVTSGKTVTHSPQAVNPLTPRHRPQADALPRVRDPEPGD